MVLHMLRVYIVEGVCLGNQGSAVETGVQASEHRHDAREMVHSSFKMGYVELLRIKENYQELMENYQQLHDLIDKLRADGDNELADEIARRMRVKEDLKKNIREVQQQFDC